MSDFPAKALMSLRGRIGDAPKSGFWSKLPKIDLTNSLDPLDRAYAVRALGGATAGAATGAGVGLLGPEEEKSWLPAASIGIGALAGAAPTLMHRRRYLNQLNKVPKNLRDRVHGKYTSQAFDALGDKKQLLVGGASKGVMPSALASGLLLPRASRDRDGVMKPAARIERREYWRNKLKEPGGREKFEDYARTYPGRSALSLLGTNALTMGLTGHALSPYTGYSPLASTAAGVGLGLATDALQAKYENQYNKDMVKHIRAKEVNKKASINVDSPIAETLAGTALGGAAGAGLGHLIFKRRGLSSFGRHIGGAAGGIAGALALPPMLTDSPERRDLRGRLAPTMATLGGIAASAASPSILGKFPKLKELLAGHASTHIPAAGAILGAAGGHALADYLTPYAGNE